MSQTTDELPVRYCHGCRNYDDHPRILDIGDAANAADDKLYHYDCAPTALLEAQGIGPDHPGLAATAKGKRGADVRKVMVEHAQAIPEAPADDQKKG